MAAFSEARRARLDTLLCDYEQARDDERVFQHLQGAAIALALTAVGLLGALKFTVFSNEPAGRDLMQELAIAGAPLLVLSTLAMIQTAGIFSTLRSFYLRALEAEIRAVSGVDGTFASHPTMPLFSMTDLVVAYSSLRPGSGKGPWRGFATMTVVVFVSLWVVFGGLVIALACDVSLPLQLAMAGAYGVGSAGLMVPSVLINLRGREIYAHYVDVVAGRVAHGLRPYPSTSSTTPRQRSLLSYLLVPRPDDLLAKWIYSVLGVATAAAVTHAGLGWTEVGIVVAVLLSTECLNYQARYQWNDLRGRHEDAHAPTATERGRLPSGAGAAQASWAVIGTRLYLFGIVLAAFATSGPSDVHPVPALVASLATVWTLAVAYEVIKHQFARGHAPRWLVALHLVCVGLGYPARFAVGWLIVCPDVSYPGFAVALGILWALGVGFCAMTWVLEAASYGSVVATGDGRALLLDRARIASKPHLGVLAPWVGVRIHPGTAPVDGTGKHARVFQELLRPGIHAWHVAYAVVLLLAVGGAGALSGLPTRTSWIVAVVAIGIGLAPLWHPGSGLRWPLASGTALVVLLVLNRDALGRPHWPGWSDWTDLFPADLFRALLLGGWLLLPALTAAAFLGQSYAGTRRAAQRLAEAIGRALVRVARFVDGAPST